MWISSSAVRLSNYSIAHQFGRDYAIEEQPLKTVPVAGKRGRPSREAVAKVSRKLKKAL